MFYKALGYAVWKGAKFYVKRKTPGGGSSQKLVAAGVVALAIGSIIALSAKRDSAGS